MKIITICSNEYPTPPPENVIHASLYMASLLAEGLAQKGHHVTFVCGQGSKVRTNKIFANTRPFFDIIDKNHWELISDTRLGNQIVAAFEIDLYLKLIETLNEEKFDLVHFHASPAFYTIPFALRTQCTNIFTMHGCGNPDVVNVLQKFDNKNNYSVSISNQQRKGFAGLRFINTIYHGIPLNKYTFHENGGGHIVFVGRLTKNKGIKEAIEVANQLDKEIHIIGEIRSSQKDFFNNDVAPFVKQSNDKVKISTLINRLLIPCFFSTGKLFLSPIQWEEPFGLVMIESMATGTPVVAFARGSVPEIIKDGETGFIVNSSDDDIRGNWIVKKTGINGLCEAVERIYSMPEEQYRQMRKACRAHVEKNFTVEKMVDEYERVYEEIKSK